MTGGADPCAAVARRLLGDRLREHAALVRCAAAVAVGPLAGTRHEAGVHRAVQTSLAEVGALRGILADLGEDVPPTGVLTAQAIAGTAP